MMNLLLAATAALTPIQAEIKEDFNSRLLDGESARYTWPERIDKRAYCGFVNARNRLGAYTGYQLFMTFTKKGQPVDVRLDEAPTHIIRTVCESLGYPLSPRDVK